MNHFNIEIQNSFAQYVFQIHNNTFKFEFQFFYLLSFR